MNGRLKLIRKAERRKKTVRQRGYKVTKNVKIISRK
jgi:DNA-binding winged helix-turn-helix (wHTH) protein